MTDPDPDPTGTSFAFTTNAGPDFSLANGETEVFADLDAGRYSVVENTPADWALADATCDNGDTPDAIDLGNGEVVTCTFTNRADPGSITIVKATDPSPDPTGTSFQFSGDVAGSIGNGQQLTSGAVPPGTYTVTESVPTGWTLGSIVCSDDDSSGDTATATATIVVAAGEDVTCTFTNVAGDVAMAVKKAASASIVSDQGEDVVFTFAVTNTGNVPFSIVSLKDDIFGPLSGDADCQVGTVLQAGTACDFQQTFLVKPSVTPDPDDPDRVIPDHVDTFEACSILASTPTVAAAGPTGCATDSVRISFSRTLVVPATPAPTTSPAPTDTPAPTATQAPTATIKPTDMLAPTDVAGGTSVGGDSGAMLRWIVFTLLAVTVVIGGAFVLRRSRTEDA